MQGDGGDQNHLLFRGNGEQKIQRINYGADIQVLRLRGDGTIGEFFEDSLGSLESSEGEEENKKGISKQKSALQNGKKIPKKRVLKKKKSNFLRSQNTADSLNKVQPLSPRATKYSKNNRIQTSENPLAEKIKKISTSSTHNLIVISCTLSSIFMTVFFCILMYNSYFTTNSLSEFSRSIRAIMRVNNVLNNIHNPVADMILFNEGNPVNDLSETDYEDLKMDRLRNAVKNLITEREILEDDMDISALSKLKEKMFSDRNLKYYSFPGEVSNTTFIDIIRNVETSTINVVNMKQANVKMTDPSVYNVIKNTVNGAQLFIKYVQDNWLEYRDASISSISISSIQNFINYLMIGLSCLFVIWMFCLFSKMIKN